LDLCIPSDYCRPLWGDAGWLLWGYLDVKTEWVQVLSVIVEIVLKLDYLRLKKLNIHPVNIMLIQWIDLVQDLIFFCFFNPVEYNFSSIKTLTSSTLCQFVIFCKYINSVFLSVCEQSAERNEASLDIGRLDYIRPPLV